MCKEARMPIVLEVYKLQKFAVTIIVNLCLIPYSQLIINS